MLLTTFSKYSVRKIKLHQLFHLSLQENLDAMSQDFNKKKYNFPV